MYFQKAFMIDVYHNFITLDSLVIERYEKEKAEAMKRLRERMDEFSGEST
jgi:predicted mannosyl-3-phosphoglycerate phosphatase (HAD superfamily)